MAPVYVDRLGWVRLGWVGTGPCTRGPRSGRPSLPNHEVEQPNCPVPVPNGA